MSILTKEQIIESTLPEEQRHDDDWGYGQMSIDRIIELNYNDSEKFVFIKKLTAMNDNWYEQTVVASEGNVFVFPVNRFFSFFPF